MVRWKIQDMFGVVKTITTKAYYVPEAQIRLMSPQKYFQEHGSGKAIFTGKEMAIHLPNNNGVLKFPFHLGNNLPFMLLNDHPSLIPLSSKDVHMLSDIRSVLTSVADQTNQNITVAQKELLMWHWIFAHANFPWIQSLFSEPRDGERPILKSHHRLTGDMVARHLKCAACELSKASKQKSVTKDPLPRGKGIVAGRACTSRRVRADLHRQVWCSTGTTARQCCSSAVRLECWRSGFEQLSRLGYACASNATVHRGRGTASDSARHAAHAAEACRSSSSTACQSESRDSPGGSRWSGSDRCGGQCGHHEISYKGNRWVLPTGHHGHQCKRQESWRPPLVTVVRSHRTVALLFYRPDDR